jgi:hypothetical protein
MKYREHILILLLSACVYLPFIGHVHLFDWDEINFAESAREMLLTSNWFQVQINFEPFWEKPPFFFWLQALSMSVFGVTEFAARLPNALAGILTIQVLFALGWRLRGKTFAWTWSLLYMGSFLPFLYFKSGIIDPWFNLFIFLAVFHAHRLMDDPKNRPSLSAALAGIFSGLAILTKGPVGLLLVLLTSFVWFGLRRFRPPIPWKHLTIFGLATLLVSLLWFGYETMSNGPSFLIEFLAYQVDLFLHPVAGHKQPFFYHFVVILLGCFPISILAIPAFSRYSSSHDPFGTWMKSLFWVVMILFSIVSTKIVHYSSMAYLPLSFLAADYLYNREQSGQKFPSWISLWILIQGLVISILIATLPIALSLKNYWVGMINDPFVRENLSVPLDMFGWESTAGIILLIGVWTLYRSFKQGATQRGMLAFTLSVGLSFNVALVLIVPKIESISQGATIAFFEQSSREEVHLATYGYKSYAQYFYGEISPQHALRAPLHEAPFALPVLVSVKMTRQKQFESEFPTAAFLYAEGGYGFYRIPGVMAL